MKVVSSFIIGVLVLLSFGVSTSSVNVYNTDTLYIHTFAVYLEKMRYNCPELNEYSFEDIKSCDSLDVFGDSLMLNAMYLVRGIHFNYIE